MKQSVGYAVIGCGTIAHFHISAILSVEDAHLAGVYDAVPEVAKAAAAKYGVRAFTGLGDLLNDGDVDVVVICTPSGSRLSIALEAATRGKHILVEKPLEVTVERARQIIDRCHEMGVTLGCVFQYRFYEDIVRIKRLVEAEKFGRLLLAEAQIKWHRTREYYSNSKWRGTWSLDGGGVLMNQGIHTIDLMQWLMGPVSKVSGFIDTLYHSMEAEDTAVASLRFETGALGIISATTATYPGMPALLSIHGTEGSAIIGGDKLVYLSLRGSGDGEINQLNSLVEGASGSRNPAEIANAGHIRVISDMTDAVRFRRPPAVTGEEALKPISIIESIYKSANAARLGYKE